MYQFSGIPFDLRASKLNNLYTYNCRQATTTTYVFKETVSFTLKTLVLHRIHITATIFRWNMAHGVVSKVSHLIIHLNTCNNPRKRSRFVFF